jgi:hypothetical protein
LANIEDAPEANMSLTGIISGSFPIKDKESRVLELVTGEDEQLSHTFLISYTDSFIWYCFYKCYESKQGAEETIDIMTFRNFLEQNKEKIIYEKHYAGKNYFFKSLEKYLELTHPDFEPMFIKPIY